jgi:type III secretory pathway component EscT
MRETMIETLFKGHHFSIGASVTAAVAIAVFLFGAPGWMPTEERHLMSSFTLMYVLLTYLFLQMVAHIFYRPPSRRQMLVDMLSSLLPPVILLCVLVDYSRGNLAVSTFQLNAALLTIYAMTLDLIVDIGLMLWPRQ